MKKLPMLLLCFVILLSGCARAFPDAGNSAAIWDDAAEDVPLSSPNSQGGTSTKQVNNKKGESAAEIQEPRISAITEEDYQSFVAPDNGSPLFLQQIQHTSISIPSAPSVEDLINISLDVNYESAIGTANELLAIAHEDYALHASNEDSWEFYGYSYYAIDSVARLDNTAFSLTTYYSSYTGGAHPDNMQKAATYSTSTGEQLSLAQVLLPEGKSQLESLILDWLGERSETYGLFEGYDEVVAEKFRADTLASQTADWYFSTDGLTVFFNPYEITPYAAGVVKITFPYSNLNGILEEAYFPSAVIAGDEDSVTAGFSWNFDFSSAEFETSETVPSHADSTSPLFFVFGTAGSTPVYDLRVYLVNWAGEQPILNRSIYAANYLSEANLVTIEIDDASISSDLCVQFAGEDGANVQYYDLSEAAVSLDASD